jgi:hypothetical protein
MLRTTILAFALAPLAVQAGTMRCADHDVMVRHLAQGWGESRQSIALDAGNSMVEVFASPETGTWTMTVTRPGGPTCMIASGHAFESIEEPLPVLDEGA